MNKILVLVVLILVPIAIKTKDDTEKILTMGKIEGEVIEEQAGEEEEAVQVLLSTNNDKSDAFLMDLEDYVIGVVAGEMPASFDEEALKAQAVASRTFALYRMSENEEYVLSTNITDQVYITTDAMQEKWQEDFTYYYDKVREAVLNTEGEILTYEGEIASTYYFAISNGYTDDALTVFNEDKDYLVSVESSWDKNYKAYSSTYTLSKSDFCRKMGINETDILISDIVRASNNYVRSININGVTFTGLEVFNKLNLKSTDFVITVLDEVVSITTYGFGHGVGMSQYGAQGMAAKGYSYEEILKYYYQDTEIAKL